MGGSHRDPRNERKKRGAVVCPAHAMNRKILLLNPPVYDFTAYDFWLKPYGLLEAGGFLRGKANLTLFDYLDRPQMPDTTTDKWGRGKFQSEDIPKPAPLAGIKRNFHRFGLERKIFQQFLADNGPFDFAMVQTVMTYWYPGVKEVIDDLHQFSPQTKIILGGNYTTLCPAHAESLGPDLVIKGSNLDPLWEFMDIKPDMNQPAFWEGYQKLESGVIRLSDGCPFACTYCSVPNVYAGFSARPLEKCLRELDLLEKSGARHIAFYDDALLFQPERTLMPFLKKVIERNSGINFHTPNALNARFLTPEIAQLMVKAGVKTFYLGFESLSADWQKKTGGKIGSTNLASAVKNLADAGADRRNITAYVITGHPDAAIQRVEASMKYANSLGVQVMLSEFAPVPGTPDGEKCRTVVDLNEPLTHNKTFFAIRTLGWEKIQDLKLQCKKLNVELTGRTEK